MTTNSNTQIKGVKTLDLNTEIVAIDDLRIDPDYQRAEVANHPARKAAFDGDLFGIPLVGRRKSGLLYCVNGQQRIAAAQSDGYTHVESIVFTSKGAAHEADVFYHANRDHKLISGVPMHKARYTARHAPALWIEGVLGDYRLTALPKGEAKSRVHATGVLYDLHAGDVLGRSTGIDEAERCMRFALDVLHPAYAGRYAARSWARSNVMAGLIITAHKWPGSDAGVISSLLTSNDVDPKTLAEHVADIGHGMSRKTYAHNVEQYLRSLATGEVWSA